MNVVGRAVIALLVFSPLTGCETMKAVDRGLYSVVESVTERDRVTGRRTLSLQNRAEQIQAGNEAAEQFIAKAEASGKKINADYNKPAYDRILRQI